MTSSSSFRAAALVSVLTGAWIVSACGGADAPPAQAPMSTMPAKASAKDEPEPKTIEEAQEQIARLSSNLDADKNDTSKPAPPPPAPDPRKVEEHSTTPGAGASSRTGDDACSNPCRALMSMKRAVDALCRMTGDGDNRCVDAKKTLTTSSTRVSPCKCGV